MDKIAVKFGRARRVQMDHVAQVSRKNIIIGNETMILGSRKGAELQIRRRNSLIGVRRLGLADGGAKNLALHEKFVKSARSVRDSAVEMGVEGRVNA